MSRFYGKSWEHSEHHHPDKGSRLENAQIKYRNFLERLLPPFFGAIGINCVITANIKFKADLDWGVQTEKLGLPFICLHRENFIAAPNAYKFVLERQKRTGAFMGRHIFVHNNSARNMFIESRTTDPTNISVLGCLRMDRLVESVKEITPWNDSPSPSRKKMVLMFALVPGHRWPDTDFFAEVNVAFAKLAISRRDISFMVKFKPKDFYSICGSRFRAAIFNAGIDIEKINNLISTYEGEAQDLISGGDVVCGLNSTSLLEAAIAGKPVVAPLLQNIKYSKQLFGGDLFR